MLTITGIFNNVILRARDHTFLIFMFLSCSYFKEFLGNLTEPSRNILSIDQISNK